MENNRTLVLQDIVAELTAATGKSEALCQAFVKNLFAVVAEQLAANGEAVLRGIGKFVVVDGNVQFEADSDAAAFVNMAFECFEPMELADDFDGEEKVDDAAEDKTEETPAAEEPQAEEQKNETSETDSEMLPPPVPESEKPGDESETPAEDTDDDAVSDEEQPNDSDEEEWTEEPKPSCGHRFLWGFISGFVVAVLLALAVYFLVPALYMPRTVATATQTDSTTVADTTVVDTAAPVKEVVEPQTDTVPAKEEKVADKEQTFLVTNTAYLSNISRKFYGHYAFWVYIYLENKDVIKDPDNLPVGAVLKIPAPEKYGIDKNNPESIKRAEIKALELKQGE